MVKDQPKPATGGDTARATEVKGPDQPKPATGGGKRFQVSVPGGPTLEVEAADSGAAFAKYKEMCGIVKSKAQPKIVPKE